MIVADALGDKREKRKVAAVKAALAG